MSQKENIRKHLKRYGQITPLDALQEYGCMRLGARILELRREGLDILTHVPAEGKRYAIYRLRQHVQLELAL